jgi:hypothetical protein
MTITRTSGDHYGLFFDSIDQTEKNSSGLLLKAGIARYSRHVANVPRGSLERRDFSRLNLFNRPLFVDLVFDLDLTIRGPFPGACRGNDQLRERRRGILRRRDIISAAICGL